MIHVLVRSMVVFLCILMASATMHAQRKQASMPPARTQQEIRQTHHITQAFSRMGSVLLEEDFTTASDSTPPAGWTSTTLLGVATDKWRFDNPGNRTTALGATAPFAGFDSDFQSFEGGEEDIVLESPPFSAPLNENICLSFVQHFRSNPFGTSAVVEAFNGTTWSPVDSTTLDVPDGTVTTVNITNEVAGVSNARIRFRFRGNWSWYWLIDDVVVTATPIAPAERLLFENFSTATGTTPPPGWTQNRIEGEAWDNWHFDNPAARLVKTPMARPAAIFDSDSLSRLGGFENVALESPTFSPLAGYAVFLKFNQFFHGDSGGRATVEVFNGSSWIEKWTSTVSSPNPDTMCINITNETAGVSNAKVRFRWTGDWSWYWIVDNVEVIQEPGTGSASITSDQFNGASLDTTLWTFVNPQGVASQAMTGTQLSIHIPAGTSHENDAPRIMQCVNNPKNFEVFVKFDALMNQAFQIQGIQVEQDSKNFLRFELYGNGSTIYRVAWNFVHGVRSDAGSADLTMLPCAPLYMKLKRQGNDWTQSWSCDGIEYYDGAQFTYSMTVTRIGFHAANVGFPPSSGPEFTGLCDYFLTSDPLPIQLASFTATAISGNSVRLDWRTLSEINNYGFYVQRKRDDETAWQEIPNSFVPGHGTTSEPRNYTWTDNSALAGRWHYRLKQVDLDGTMHYTEPVQVDVLTSVEGNAPRIFSLHQNFPNPFNPSTEIKFSVENTGQATLELYNLLGQHIATLFNDVAQAGQYYRVKLDGSGLASGMYLYRLQSGNRTDLKKMVLLK